MIKVLEKAIEKLKGLSEDKQRYAAEVLEKIADSETDVYTLTEEERRLLQEGLDELDRGEAASEADVRAVFDRYRQ